MYFPNFLLPLALCTLAIATDTADPAKDLPTVDLGYGVYRASYYNASYDAYVFSNIRFAAPPVGKLRFSPPQAPLLDRSKIHDGSEGVGCIGALAGSPVLPPGFDGPEGEDCLFLDVIVPRKVLSGKVASAPVLFWIFGGGYTVGTKNSMGDPITFLVDSPSPVIWVAINYRLGHFGFLNGPTLTQADGAIPNAGLYDQRFGLQWVQDKIHLFGGNRDEVTVMGVSSGAGSLVHHITAYGGNDSPAMFKRVVSLSAGWFPYGGHSDVEDMYIKFEAAVGCAGKGVECIRAAPVETLTTVNKDIITTAAAPRLGPGPSIDGNFIPDMPPFLLTQGRFHNNISVLTLDDSNEGLNFLDPTSTLTAEQAVDSLFPNLTPSTRTSLLSLYPPPNATTLYTTENARYVLIISDAAFDHVRYALCSALATRCYNVVSKGVHGDATQNIFGSSPNPFAPALVLQMRQFVMRFVVTGDPNAAGPNGVAKGVRWPVFAEGKQVAIDGVEIKVVDASARTDVWKWWAKGLVLS